jgi:hypothetical protein
MAGGRMLLLACREREHLRLLVLILLISRRNILSLPISSAWFPSLQGQELTSLVRSWSWISCKRVFSLEKVLIRCWSSYLSAVTSEREDLAYPMLLQYRLLLLLGVAIYQPRQCMLGSWLTRLMML